MPAKKKNIAAYKASGIKAPKVKEEGTTYRTKKRRISPIRPEFHKLIDNFSDEELLEHFYEAMKETADIQSRQMDWWDELSEERKKYLEAVIKESGNEENLIPIEKAMAEIKEWVKELSFQKKRKTG